MPTTLAERVRERIDSNILNETAYWAAVQLQLNGFARIAFEPKDASRYGLTIIHEDAVASLNGADGGRGRDTWRNARFFVSVDHGKSYPWEGWGLHSDYVADKWDLRAWDAEVITMLLNTISELLPERWRR